MRERFISKDFSDATVRVIAQAAQILGELAEYQLTLRQLYYQFVARGLLPNKQREYKRLGRILNDARLAGLIDWDSIEDRTRNVARLADWDGPEDILHGAARQYREDVWRLQEVRPEVWIEKEALVGVIAGVCNRNRVPYLACRGYASQSEAYDAGKRFAEHRRLGYRPIVFHLGDHDPSGIDMTRDNRERLSMFARGGVEVRRLALNFDQVEEHEPPPNPAKTTDSRFESYVVRYGRESWELDALHPKMIESLIEDAIDAVRDPDDWELAMEQERENREAIYRVSNNWDEVLASLTDDAEEV